MKTDPVAVRAVVLTTDCIRRSETLQKLKLLPMVKIRQYTVGEIFRGQMLLNMYGKPYGDKAAVAKAVKRLKWVVTETKWGPSKSVPLSEIQKHNASIKAYLPTADRD
jgi:hypothetical protein